MLDISRLIWRGRRAAPSGIDRVELAYAEHFLAVGARRPTYAVVHVLGWVFGVNDAGARRFVQRLGARWRGEPDDGPPRTRFSRLRDLYGSLLLGQWRVGFQLRREFRRHAEAPIFLVVSHHHLNLDHTMRSIRRSFGAHCACFLHDLIPLDYPEYFSPGLARGFKRLPETIAACFDAVIANSRTTAEALRKVLSSMGGTRAPMICVAPPGARAFPSQCAVDLPQDAHSVPYFIVLGTIEPRKNHLLLLNLWVRLAATLQTPPRLLVIGARGWENEQVVDMLERSSRLRGVVEEHPALDDTAVGSLLRAARAVLVPSFAEGYGLTLVEALASGVPVICSDIPVFREVGGDVPDYVDPLDLPAWQEVVVDYSLPGSLRRAAQLRRLAHWQAPRWTDHFEIVEAALDQIEQPSRVSA